MNIVNMTTKKEDLLQYKHMHFIPLKSNTIDVDEVIKLIAYDFANNEATSKALNIQPKELEEFFDKKKRLYIDHSFVVINPLTAQIMGAILCADFFEYINEKAEVSQLYSEEFLSVGHLLSQLESAFATKYSESMKKTTCLYQLATYVNQSINGYGIGTKLYSISEEYARKSGFKKLVTISTGRVSQHIRINKLNFKKIEQLEYKEFEFNGKKTFSNIDADYCMLLAKDIEELVI